ncbi:MAG: hypothetical protein FWD06_00130 [Oscillospiraceae bacterium]|nr:hypothetical protein [Oscillospiraceae bacterium]
MKKILSAALALVLIVGVLGLNASAANEDVQWVAVSAGLNHTLALDSHGNVWAWGSNAYGQLGDGSRVDRNIPTQLTVPGRTFQQVEAGGDRSFAICDEGNIWAWGRSGRTDVSAPHDEFSGLLGLPQVSYHENATTARLNHGRWSGGSVHASVPTQITGIIVTRNGVDQYRVGLPVYADNLAPINPFIQISAGPRHALALDSSGRVFGWGDNRYGQICSRSITRDAFPINHGAQDQNSTGVDLRHVWLAPKHLHNIQTNRAGADVAIVQVAAGDDHSLILLNNGEVWAGGLNTDGQLGARIGRIGWPVFGNIAANHTRQRFLFYRGGFVRVGQRQTRSFIGIIRAGNVTASFITAQGNESVISPTCGCDTIS